MQIVELVWACDRLKLYNDLEMENRDDTFSLRGMLWLLTTGILKNGHVFVDDWPEFTHICCLHSSKLYSQKSDRDIVTICTCDFSTFPDFFREMIKTRKWIERGITVCYVEEKVTKLAEEIFRNHSNGSFWKSRMMRHYTALERKNFHLHLEQRKWNFLKTTPGLRIDQLRPDEAYLVAREWPYQVPEKEEMFKWLIRILPSTCIRDPQHKPVAWTVMYSFCAAGAAYVYPEYRGKHLVDAMVTPLIVAFWKLCPTQCFFWILDNNVASQRQVHRTMADAKRTDTFVCWFSYTPVDSENVKAKL